MSLQFTRATRQGVKPLIDLYSESGCGKTYSALLLARGIVGPNGKIAMGDSESGRGSLYADVLPGGYDVIGMNAPFSPDSYVKVIEAAEQGGYDILILDSMSHEWEGIGGVLDMAGDIEKSSGRPGLHCWKVPKLEHNKLVLKLLQTRLAIICCIRAKFKSRQIKNERGKTEIVKDDVPSPIQSEEFIFEATAHALILPDHTIRLTKCSHPDLRACFPEDAKEPLSIKHGEAIARWAQGGTGARTETKPRDPLATAKAALWAAAKPKFKELPVFVDWLRKNGYLGDTQTLDALTAEQLTALVQPVEDAEFQF